MKSYFFDIIGAVISGLFTAASFHFPQLSFLIWFSLAPFFYLLQKSNFKQGLILSFSFALAFYGFLLFWVVHVTLLGLILLVLYLSLYPVLFFILGRVFMIHPKIRFFNIINVPCLWVVLELLKEIIWCGFGWGNLGYSQYCNLFLIQPVDFGGVKFISFLIVMVNVFFCEVYDKKRIDPQKTIFIVFLFTSCVFYSGFKLTYFKATESVNISLVQPNISEERKWKETEKSSIADTFVTLTQKTNPDSLVIFPEAAWLAIINDVNQDALKAFVSEMQRDIIMGAVRKKQNHFYNAALYLNKNGDLIDEYHKIKLVPYGEYVPLRSYLSFIEVINTIGDMSRGQTYNIFHYNDKKFSVLICFEDVFPFFVSRFAQGRDFLVNITNDGWFQGEPEASQHLAIMVFRAIENRISIVRCANTGISGWVSFKGDVHKLMDQGRSLFFSGSGNFEVSLNRAGSFYRQHGEIFSFACLMWVIIVGMGSRLFLENKTFERRRLL